MAFQTPPPSQIADTLTSQELEVLLGIMLPPTAVHAVITTASRNHATDTLARFITDTLHCWRKDLTLVEKIYRDLHAARESHVSHSAQLTYAVLGASIERAYNLSFFPTNRQAAAWDDDMIHERLGGTAPVQWGVECGVAPADRHDAPDASQVAGTSASHLTGDVENINAKRRRIDTDRDTDIASGELRTIHAQVDELGSTSV